MSRYILKIAVIAGLTLAVASCSKDDPTSTSAAAATPGKTGGQAQGQGKGGGGRRGGGGPVTVVTAKAQSKGMPVTIPAVGTAEALATVQIRAQVTGQLSTVHFKEGDAVRKGQLLFELDPRPFDAALKQADAVLARDTATARNAERQRANYEDLWKRGLIPRDQYETQTATGEALQATLAADRAAVENARLNLSYTRISAPINGRTGSLGVHAGDLVRANDQTPMVIINQLSPIYVSFAVPGRYLGDIRRYQSQKALVALARGQAAVAPGAQAPPPIATPGTVGPQQVAPGQGATAAVTPGPMETGRVTFIDNAVDASTGTIKLKATFDNADQGLWPGLFVQITLNLTTEENAIVVPATAVQPSASGQYVYVVRSDHTAEVRPVTVARQAGEEMIIARGIEPGEEVVVDGQLKLTPGATVTTGGGRGEGGSGGGGQGGRGRGGEGGGRGGRGRRNSQ